MKKTFTLLLPLALCLSAQAQLAKKYVYFEHFTQASCPPCAQQNPIFESTIMAAYPTGIHHIAYHTSWPGYDPMNTHNAPQVASRVSYYGVTGVPNMMLNGANKGGPAGVTTQMVDQVLAQGSPVKVDVTQTIEGTDIKIKVTVTTVGDKPAGSYKLLTAVVERDIVYTSAPGTNGEKAFPNVFRKMATADNGNDITLPEKGLSTEYNFTVPVNAAWKQEEMFSLAAVQSSTREVINSGTSLDAPAPITYGFLGDPSKSIDAGTSGVQGTYSVPVKNTGSSAGNFKITLTSVNPSDWAAALTVGGTTIQGTGEAQISIPANTTLDASVMVTPGSSAAVGEYVITFESADAPGTIVFTKTVRIIANVNDLVINHSEATSDGKATKSWENIFLDGLNDAGNTAHASADTKFLLEALKGGLLTDVKSLYYNVGWSIGSFDGEMVAELKKFLDSGKNMFVSGQDVAWEYSDGQSPYRNTAVINFFRDYFGVTYVSDNSAVYTMNADANEFFAAVGNVVLNRTFYTTAGNCYPDDIKAATGGVPIFRYNATKTAGIRFSDNTKKIRTVYMGVGPEQFSDAAKKNQLLKLTHDYFYSVTSVNENSAAAAGLLGNVAPNPAKDMITFSFGNLPNDMTLSIIDVTGKTVYTQPVWTGMTSTSIKVDQLTAGLYFYQLVDGNNVVATKKLTITK
ncbi:MAG: Omp28-related outer membrane protein [Bacteroidota bacterium]